MSKPKLMTQRDSAGAKFHPLRNQLLVRPLPDEVNGLIIPDVGTSRRPTLGAVLEAGPAVESPLVTVGAVVMYYSTAGAVWRMSGQGELRLLSETDLFGVMLPEVVAAGDVVLN